MTPSRPVLYLSLFLSAQQLCRADPTACDGPDGGIENCCFGVSSTGICEYCKEGYGLVNGGKGCAKCKDPACLSCNESLNFCKDSEKFKGKIPNCSLQSGNTCIYCKEGYDFGEDRNSCFKCPVSNCDACPGLKVCTRCDMRYGLVDGKCQKCSEKRCYDCDGDIKKCKYCQSDWKDGKLTAYSPLKGVCTACPTGAFQCYDQGLTCELAYYLDKASKSCKQCPKSCAKCTNPTMCIRCNDGKLAVNGKCQEGASSFQGDSFVQNASSTTVDGQESAPSSAMTRITLSQLPTVLLSSIIVLLGG